MKMAKLSFVLLVQLFFILGPGILGQSQNPKNQSASEESATTVRLSSIEKQMEHDFNQLQAQVQSQTQQLQAQILNQNQTFATTAYHHILVSTAVVLIITIFVGYTARSSSK